MAELDSVSLPTKKCTDKDTLLSKPTKRKTKCKYILFVIIILLILVAAGIAVYYLVFKESSKSDKRSFFTIKQPTSIYIYDQAELVMHVDYCDFVLDDYNEITNQTTNLISVHTRCYCWNYEESTNIEVIPSSDVAQFDLEEYHCDLPAPTLYIKNNMTFDIIIINEMKGAALDPARHHLRLWPDVTNMHTHGLHVDPIWDNVFRIIDPDTTETYHYEMPEYHYPGTHWYHPHIHGSTNYQVHGGMFGALIVENDELDEDDLPDFHVDELTDVILEFHYFYVYTTDFCDCSKTEQEILDDYTYVSNGAFRITSLCYDWCMMPDDIRNISGYEYSAESDIANEDNGFLDLILLNGQYEPNINIEAYKWYNFRMLNANGQYYTQINFQNVLTDPDLCSIHLLGNDGIFFNVSRNIRYAPYYNEIIIGPGSRADVAIKCKYNVNHTEPIRIKYSTNILNNIGIPRFPEANHTIFSIHIHETNAVYAESKDAEFDVSPFLKMPERPHYLMVDEEVLTDVCPCYTYNETNTQCHFTLGGSQINGISFNASRPLLRVCQNDVLEFEVSGIHPLHIHNTPFQIQRNLPLNGDDFDGFMAMEGDWRDTVAINDGNYKIRYPTEHFNGPVILHCHFLPHEDDGMIAYMEVIDCDDPQELDCDA